jgi:ketosteroid isomerase-like protein
MDTRKITTEILVMISAMNRAWTAGWHEEEFRRYIHEDAVAIVPSEPGRLEGRDAYVAGWRGFTRSAVIHEWRETGHNVKIFNKGKCAVATYFFTITFTRGTTKVSMQGRDMFFLVKEGKKWLVAADQFSPEPPES